MINLLPDKKRNKLEKEYVYRVVLMGSMLLISSLLIFNIIITTFYFILQSEKRELEATISNSETSDDVIQNIAIIDDLDRKLDILSSSNNKNTPSHLIKIITDSKNEKIKISSIEYRAGELEEVMNVAGIAKDRSGLVAYLSVLEKVYISSCEVSCEGKTFTTVSSPISDLSKSVDINFSIDLTIAYDERQ